MSTPYFRSPIDNRYISESARVAAFRTALEKDAQSALGDRMRIGVYKLFLSLFLACILTQI